MDRTEYLRDYYDKYSRRVKGHRPLIPAAPVVEHINQCLDSGMTVSRVADECGLPDSTLRKLLNDPGRRVRSTTAERILAVIPRSPVTAIGITRRVRALNAIGWSTADIAQHAGLNLSTVKAWRLGTLTNPRRAEAAILRTYDALHLRRPPTEERYDRARATRTSGEALRNGWPPPLAWDDIDDVDENPQAGADHKRTFADLDEWLFLVHGGEDPERAAKRLGVGIEAIARAADRHDRPEIVRLANPAVQLRKNARERNREAHKKVSAA